MTTEWIAAQRWCGAASGMCAADEADRGHSLVVTSRCRCLKVHRWHRSPLCLDGLDKIRLLCGAQWAAESAAMLEAEKHRQEVEQQPRRPRQELHICHCSLLCFAAGSRTRCAAQGRTATTGGGQAGKEEIQNRTPKDQKSPPCGESWCHHAVRAASARPTSRRRSGRGRREAAEGGAFSTQTW